MTYIVADSERFLEGISHVGVVHRHENGVDDDADGDEQVDEGVHDEQLDDVRDLVPERVALPAEHQLQQLLLHKLLLVHALLVAEPACTDQWKLEWWGYQVE